jgi:hypothetical protein
MRALLAIRLATVTLCFALAGCADESPNNAEMNRIDRETNVARRQLPHYRGLFGDAGHRRRGSPNPNSDVRPGDTVNELKSTSICRKFCRHEAIPGDQLAYNAMSFRPFAIRARSVSSSGLTKQRRRVGSSGGNVERCSGHRSSSRGNAAVAVATPRSLAVLSLWITPAPNRVFSLFRRRILRDVW